MVTSSVIMPRLAEVITSGAAAGNGGLTAILRWMELRQLLLVLVAALAAYFLAGRHPAISLLLGGSLGWLGLRASAWRATRGLPQTPPASATAVMLGLLLAELYKLGIILGGFLWLLLWYQEVRAIWMLVGLSLSLAVYWLAWHRNHTQS